MKTLWFIETSVTAYYLTWRNVWEDAILIFNLILNLMLPASFVLVLQSWRFTEGFLCVNAWGRVTVIRLGTKYVRDLWVCQVCKKCCVEKLGKLLLWIKALAVYTDCIEFHAWDVQLCESVVKWKHYWFDKLIDRVKKNQLDPQLILSIFRQPLHVSGVSRPIIRRYNRMYTTVGTYYSF